MTKKHKIKVGMSLYLAGSMLLTMPNMTVLAVEAQSSFTDTRGHWASEAIERMSSYKLVNGYNGLFRPSDFITRGEMSIIIDHVMDYQNSATNTFTDLEEAFYTDAVLKAYEADLLLESNGLVRPKENITRQEVAYMIYNAFDIETSTEASNFLDAHDVAAWATESVNSLAAKGVIQGSEGKFRPNAPITRAEAVTILNRLLTGYYNTAGTYTGEVNGTAVISAADANLKDVVIKGDLIIAEGVAEGDVVLNNVTVEGRTIIRGGGVNSIKVEGSSKLKDVVMAKEGPAVRIAVSDSATVNNVTVGKKSNDVVVAGNIGTVKLEAKGAGLTVQEGKIETLEVAAENAKVDIKGAADIKTLNVSEQAKDTKVDVSKNATIRTVNADAKATISGAGTVAKVNANANDVAVKTTGTEVVAATGTTGVMAGNEPVKGGSSSNTTKPNSGNSSNSGSSGDSGNSGNSGNPGNSGNTQNKDLAITKVESVRNGLVRVTLNKASDKRLTKSQFSIICTGAGKDMTVLSVNTIDNKVYDLTTSYFDDNTYSLGILLDNGKLIQKDFVSKFDCPEIKSESMTRVSETSAEFTFISDTAGTFYYALGKAAPARTISNEISALSPANYLSSARTLFNEEPTAEELMQKGTKVDMKYQYNELQINSLTANTPYTLYYVAVDHDNKVTPVKSIQIAAEPAKTPEPGNIQIESAKGFAIPGADFFDEQAGFEFVLSEATQKPLELKDITITCPQEKDLTIGRVETKDNKNYKVYMKPGYMYTNGNTYAITIKFSDGTIATKKLFVDIWVDDVTRMKVEATTSGAIQVTFNAKEGGKIYYDVTSEDQGHTGFKDPTELFAKGKVQPITSGYNKISNIVATKGQWFIYTLEDEVGNRMPNYYAYKVPAYIEPTPEEKPEEKPEAEKAPEIIGIEYSATGGRYNKGKITVTLSRAVNVAALNPSEASISNTKGRVALEATIPNDETDTVQFDIGQYNSGIINSGDHRFSMKLSYQDKDGNVKNAILIGNFTTS